MGADDFQNNSSGATASEAFKAAVDEALWAYGHSGYSGTIAEKNTFKEVFPESNETPTQCMNRHIDEDTFDDKWGPAGCVKLEAGKYAFFGWASS